MNTRKTILALIIIVLCCGLYADRAQATWSTDPTVNNAISTAAFLPGAPAIVSDGSGGAIIVWNDYRNGVDSDIYAQRIDASGNVRWTADGVAISQAAGEQEAPTLVSDGNGGAIITWMDSRSGLDTDIYAQRIDANGVVQWTLDGVPISQAADDQQYPTLVSDGSSGAIIAWYDYRSGTDDDIYAQRVDASGNVQWTADGVAISTAAGDQAYPTLVSDGSGGAIITWQDFRSGTNWDIYARRINASGAVQWAPNGVGISTAAGDQQLTTMVSDGNGGAIITWQDSRSGVDSDIYAQRIDASGNVQWTADGVPISQAAGHQWSPTLVGDGSGGAIITWMDGRIATWDIYAQRINASGVVQWAPNGVAISTAADDQEYPILVSDGSGGAIITWEDTRNGLNLDIYAQRVDASGNVQWTADGVPISTAAGVQQSPTLVSDGSGGAIITWQDYRSGTDWDIYAQRVNAVGALVVNLSVTTSGSGSGTVTSDPVGIDCGSTCSAQFALGTTVKLIATANAGSTVSWTTCSGIISGNGTTSAVCIFDSLDGDKTAKATFDIAPLYLPLIIR